MAVVIAVGLPDGKLFAVKKDVGRSHVIQKIANVFLCEDKLHGNIVADLIDGNRRIFAYLACDAVVKWSSMIMMQ